MKFLMGKALIQRGEEHEEILLTLNELLTNQQQMEEHLGIQLNSGKENPPSSVNSLAIKVESD